MASYLKMELLLDLADGNKFRIREDAAGFLFLAVKIGAGAIQEVKLSQAEAVLLRTALQALIYAKEKVPAGA